jgi:hypothetical protein
LLTPHCIHSGLLRDKCWGACSKFHIQSEAELGQPPAQLYLHLLLFLQCCVGCSLTGRPCPPPFKLLIPKVVPISCHLLICYWASIHCQHCIKCQDTVVNKTVLDLKMFAEALESSPLNRQLQHRGSCHDLSLTIHQWWWDMVHSKVTIPWLSKKDYKTG